jgi:hypothetical protein
MAKDLPVFLLDEKKTKRKRKKQTTKAAPLLFAPSPSHRTYNLEALV